MGNVLVFVIVFGIFALIIWGFSKYTDNLKVKQKKSFINKQVNEVRSTGCQALDYFVDETKKKKFINIDDLCKEGTIDYNEEPYIFIGVHDNLKKSNLGFFPNLDTGVLFEDDVTKGLNFYYGGYKTYKPIEILEIWYLISQYKGLYIDKYLSLGVDCDLKKSLISILKNVSSNYCRIDEDVYVDVIDIKNWGLMTIHFCSCQEDYCYNSSEGVFEWNKDLMYVRTKVFGKGVGDRLASNLIIVNAYKRSKNDNIIERIKEKKGLIVNDLDIVFEKALINYQNNDLKFVDLASYELDKVYYNEEDKYAIIKLYNGEVITFASMDIETYNGLITSLYPIIYFYKNIQPNLPYKFMSRANNLKRKDRYNFIKMVYKLKRDNLTFAKDISENGYYLEDIIMAYWFLGNTKGNVKFGDIVILFDIINKETRLFSIGVEYEDMEDEHCEPLLEESTLGKDLIDKKFGDIVCDRFIVLQIFG